MGDACRTCATRPARSSAGPIAPGKPFEECPSCGDYVERVGFSEWATMPAHVKARNVMHCVLLALLAGALTGAGYALWAIVLRDGPTVGGTSIAFGVGFALTASWRGFWLGEAIQRSRRRMTDPMYTARLMEFELERLGAHAKSGSTP